MKRVGRAEKGLMEPSGESTVMALFVMVTMQNFLRILVYETFCLPLEMPYLSRLREKMADSYTGAAATKK